MGTKLEPGKFDCYANARMDEPMLILLARDPGAPETVRAWASIRRNLIRLKLKPESDHEMVAEALQCADEMERWRAKNWK
jgi:hypothetical protein